MERLIRWVGFFGVAAWIAGGVLMALVAWKVL